MELPQFSALSTPSTCRWTTGKPKTLSKNCKPRLCVSTGTSTTVDELRQVVVVVVVVVVEVVEVVSDDG